MKYHVWIWSIGGIILSRIYRRVRLVKCWRVLDLNPCGQRFSRPIQDGPVLIQLPVKLGNRSLFTGRKAAGDWRLPSTPSPLLALRSRMDRAEPIPSLCTCLAWKGKSSPLLRDKHVPVEICAHEIPCGLAWDRTLASTVWGRRQNAWDMAELSFCTGLYSV